MNSVAGFECSQPSHNSYTSKNVQQPNSTFNHTNSTISENAGSEHYKSNSNQDNFGGQQEESGMSLSNGNSPSLHVGRMDSYNSELNSQLPSLQFKPSVSNYLSSNRNAANSSVPSFSQKSCGLTSSGRLMSLPVNSDGRDRVSPGMGEAPSLGNSDNCTFTTNGNGIIGEAVVQLQPSRQITNPPSPKTFSSGRDYSPTTSLNSKTNPFNGNDYKSSFPDLNELRLRAYQENNKPNREDKKLELADSMEKLGNGIGIVPGRNHGSNNSASSRCGRGYRERDYQKSYAESMYPFVKAKTLQSQSIGSMNTSKDQTCSSTVSRAQDMIEKVKSEIGKAKSLVSLKKEGVAYGEHSDNYWLTMGVPQFEGFEDILGNKCLNRVKQQEYREALELQIRQKEERKVLELQKEYEHPLGEGQIENAFSFGQARLGQYPNLRLPRNKFSRFENSVIHKSSFNTSGNNATIPNPTYPSSSGPKPMTKPEFNQGYPQNHTIPLQQSNNNNGPVQRPYFPPFYPNPQHPQIFPMQLPPPQMQCFPHPMQMQTAPIPWPAPVYPYHQYLQPNQTQHPVHQHSQYMQKNYSDFSNAEHWNKIKESPDASQFPKPSLPSITENNPGNCCTLPQKADQGDQEGNQFQPFQPLLVAQPSSVQLKQSYSSLEDEIDLEKLEEDDYENKTKLRVWQTSDQLPDPELKMAYWKAKIKRQIVEKQQQRQVEKAEVTEAERRLDQKIQEDLEAERRDLNLEHCTTEQTLKHKLNTREIDHEGRGNGNEDETSWKLGGGDTCDNSNYPVKPHENRMSNINGRKLSPPVPASQRSLQIQNNHLDSDICKTRLQRPSASDPSFLNYIVRALENETEKQERKLRKKLERNNKII